MWIKSASSRILQGFSNIIVFLFSLSCIFPMLWLLNSSLRSEKSFMQNNLKLAVPPLFDNFSNAAAQSGLMNSIIFSGVLSILSVVFVVVFSFTIGYFLARYNFVFKKVIYLFFLAGMVVPILSLLIPVFIQFKTLGLLNHRLTLLLPYIAFSMPFSVIVNENYVHSIPREMDEAAYMEGCSTFSMLTGIIFPMCLPVTSIVIITSFISAWNEFPFSLVLVKDEAMRAVSVGIRMFNQEHTVNYTLYMAALVITIIPILVIYSILNRKIMEGMTLGAVKG